MILEGAFSKSKGNETNAFEDIIAHSKHVMILKATSHTSQEPWPCTCKGLQLSSTCCICCPRPLTLTWSAKICVRQIITKILIICHVGIHADFESSLWQRIRLLHKCWKWRGGVKACTTWICQSCHTSWMFVSYNK